jgi:hypothetical protein
VWTCPDGASFASAQAFRDSRLGTQQSESQSALSAARWALLSVRALLGSGYNAHTLVDVSDQPR